MLKSHLDIALKEWAVVQHSLLDQHQIMLLRKGGIAEESGDFDLRSESFLLLPGYEHETERRGDIQPCFEQWLSEEEANRPVVGKIRLECACDVQRIVRIENRNALINLMPQHIWSKQFIDGRFDWEPYKPISVLLVRAYRLPQPIIIDSRREYGGCRSWVTLESQVDVSGASPAIESLENFNRRLELTSSLLTH